MTHTISFIGLLTILTVLSSSPVSAQNDTTQTRKKIKEIVTVEERHDRTRVTFPGGKVEVREFSDTITQVTVGTRRFDIIEHQSGNTRIQMVRVPRDRFKGHWSGFDLGFNNFFSSPFNSGLPPEDAWMDLNGGKSMSVGFNLLQYNIGLQKNNNNLGLVTGLGWLINNYRLDSQHIMRRRENGITGFELSERNIDKNKLVTSFITIPLLFEVQLPFKDRNADFFFSVGPYGSFRLGSHTKVVFNDQDGKEKEKWREDLNINPFKYGMMVRTGYKWLKFFATFDLSPMIEKNRGPELYLWSIGLTLVQF